MAVDHRGNQVRTLELTADKQRATKVAHLRTRLPALTSGAPTPEDLGDIFDSVLKGGVGSADRFLDLAADMERRDGHYRAQLGTRKHDVCSVETALRGGDDRRTELVREVLKAPWFGNLRFDLLDGLGKSYSVCELHWETGAVWKPAGYKHRDPRHFHWDESNTIVERDHEHWNKTNPLPAYVYAVHEPHLISGPTMTRGLAWACAFYSMAKSFSFKDWLALSEIFGIPIRVGKYDDNTTDDEKDKLEDAIQGLGQEAAAMIHKGTELVLLQAQGAAGSAEKLYRACIEVCNQEISKAISHQTMTMEDGSSRSQAEVHERKLATVDEVTAEGLCATINRDILLPLQVLNFGESDDPVQLYVPQEEEEDLERLGRILGPMVDRGMQVPVSWIREKIGAPEPEGDEPVLQPLKSGDASGDPEDDDAKGSGSSATP